MRQYLLVIIMRSRYCSIGFSYSDFAQIKCSVNHSLSIMLQNKTWRVLIQQRKNSFFSVEQFHYFILLENLVLSIFLLNRVR